MARQESKDIVTQGNNYLAALHTLKFSKEGKDVLEQMDIDRRSLAIKFLAAKMFSSQDTAACLLKQGLEEYHNCMENKNGVNNYWRQFKAQCPKVNNDPMQWKSSLTDPKDALEFINPLPCQIDKTLPCANMYTTDRQIERIVSLWKDEGIGIRKRKINNKNVASDGEVLQTENDEDMDVVTDSPPKLQSLCNKQASTHQQPPIRHINKPQPKNQNDYNSSVLRDRYNKVNSTKNVAISKTPVYANPDNEESETPRNKMNPFKTAAELKKEQQAKTNKPMQKKTLGGRAPVNAPFVCPVKRTLEENMEAQGDMAGSSNMPEEMSDERLKNIEPKMVELIKNEIMDSGTPISWDDIAGLDYAKKIIKEVVVFPMLRPDIFTGLRRPPKGILLFGPPGTGKTLIGKCIASQSKSTFFSISASSLTSKWVGEGEKMVRALFAVARVYQPSVVFIDEIDSLLTQRSETEHESSRRIKTEFLVQLDGAATSEEDRLLIVGATNRPQELDEAARRRLVKRLYIPLPELEARKQIVNNLLTSIPHNLDQEDVLEVAKQAEGYSGADMTNLCKEASMGPIRSIPFNQLENVRKEDVRKVTAADFADALTNVRPSVSQADLSIYIQWDNTYGSGMARSQIK